MKTRTVAAFGTDLRGPLHNIARLVATARLKQPHCVPATRSIMGATHANFVMPPGWIQGSTPTGAVSLRPNRTARKRLSAKRRLSWYMPEPPWRTANTLPI